MHANAPARRKGVWFPPVPVSLLAFMGVSSTPVYPHSVAWGALAHYQFPVRGDMPAVKLHWYDGGHYEYRKGWSL